MSIHCRNRPYTIVREIMEVRAWKGELEGQRKATN